MIDSIKPEQALWDLYTMRQEYGQGDRDEYGRLRLGSLPLDAFEVPLVSKHLKDRGMTAEYPGSRGFAVCLTHDIDLMYYGPMVPFVRRRGLAHRLLRSLSRRMSPRWNIGDIADLEERFGAKSTFFFEAFEPGDKDFNYHLDDLRDQIRDIVGRGFEAGLHGGHGAHQDLAKLRAEKARLESVSGAEADGYRGHYLRFDVPGTWHLLRQAGFSYDSTVGFADRVGFRNGMCHPFRPFDRDKGEEVDILEVPLAVMDGALLERMGLGLAAAERLLDKLSAQVKDCNGALTVLWHNTHCGGSYGRLYERMLGKWRDQGAWLTSARELARWWDAREEVPGP